MKFSIAIPVWNRRTLLKRALDRLAEFKNTELEVSLFEDVGNPEEKLNPKDFEAYPFPIIHIYGEERPIPRCPVREINVAAKKTTGDIVCVQAAEIFHLQNGFAELDLLIRNGGTENQFFISPTINLDEERTEEFFSGKLDILSQLDKIHLCKDRSKSYFNNVASMRWGVHPQYNPTPIAQFIAMHRSTWNKIGGFSEEYGDGNSWGDQDILMKLWAAKAELVWLNSVVVHPYHGENYSTEKQARAGNRNRRIFEQKWGVSGEEIDRFYRMYSVIRPAMSHSNIPAKDT